MYMQCSVVATKVSDIIDHKVDIVTRIRFYMHLMMCSKCRNYLQQFKTLKKASSLPDPDELPNDFDNVLGFIMDEIETKKEEKKEY